LKDPAAAPDLALARQRKPVRGKPARRGRGDGASWEGVDRDLFDRLRALRLGVARRRGVPPYVIFHDATLRELARERPATREALRHIYGVGERKAEDFGEAILDVIRGAPAE
jgi:ATP-dependent DNA helicase RecQ